MIVVLFSAVPRGDLDLEDYQLASARMREVVATVPGLISSNSYRAEDGETVALVRFDSEEALDAWRLHPEHREAQDKGRHSYYQEYWVQVCSHPSGISVSRQRTPTRSADSVRGGLCD